MAFLGLFWARLWALILAVLSFFWGRALRLNFGHFGSFFGVRLWALILAFLGLNLGKALGLNFGVFGPFFGHGLGP